MISGFSYWKQLFDDIVGSHIIFNQEDESKKEVPSLDYTPHVNRDESKMLHVLPQKSQEEPEHRRLGAI